MLDFANEAHSISLTTTRQEFEGNRVQNLAIVRLLEVIGEAANRIPDEDRLRYPVIPWQQIIGMRNRLIHGYDTLDYEVIWHTVTQDLPPLIEELKKILND